MKEKSLTCFNYNKKLKYKNYLLLVIGILLLPVIIMINIPLIALSLIILIVLLSLKSIIFNKYLISFFVNHIEINMGILSGKQIININSIESIVKGTKTFVINLKWIKKPIIIELNKLNKTDVVSFKKTINKTTALINRSKIKVKSVRLIGL